MKTMYDETVIESVTAEVQDAYVELDKIADSINLSLNLDDATKLAAPVVARTEGLTAYAAAKRMTDRWGLPELQRSLEERIRRGIKKANSQVSDSGVPTSQKTEWEERKERLLDNEIERRVLEKLPPELRRLPIEEAMEVEEVSWVVNAITAQLSTLVEKLPYTDWAEQNPSAHHAFVKNIKTQINWFETIVEGE